jgi:hypothetical protein
MAGALPFGLIDGDLDDIDGSAYANPRTDATMDRPEMDDFTPEQNSMTSS